MALINCPECGKEVSSSSVNCVHCGFPIIKPEVKPDPPAKPEKQSSSFLSELFGIVLTIGILAVGAHYFLQYKYDMGLPDIAKYFGLISYECGDKEVQDTTLKLIKDKLLPQLFDKYTLSVTTLSLGLVRTKAANKDIKYIECQADLIIKNSSDSSDDITASFEYSVSQGAKNGEYIVEVKNLDPKPFLRQALSD
ncbi:MAG: zinc ribbon domain-containing protein [Deltaproteobacteria bacterium]|jgi:hypothetical protein|nr:zinc ribbon domain-containing protein [Deltaproteobacteria bacterium]